MSSHHTQHSFLSKVSSGPEAKLLEEDVRVRIAALPPPPTKAELRTARDSALKLLHDLFHCRGVRHLDGDLADGRWRVYSEKHILEGELGALQDEHRAILEELVDRKVDRGVDADDVDDTPELLAALGALRAKARDTKGATRMLLMAATERDRRRDLVATCTTRCADCDRDLDVARAATAEARSRLRTLLAPRSSAAPGCVSQ